MEGPGRPTRTYSVRGWMADDTSPRNLLISLTFDNFVQEEIKFSLCKYYFFYPFHILFLSSFNFIVYFGDETCLVKFITIYK